MSAAFVLDNFLTRSWAGSSVEDYIKDLWTVGDRSSFLTLNETKAAPGTPFPRVLYSIGDEFVSSRMSGPGQKKFHTKQFPLTFMISAQQAEVGGETKSSKEIARNVTEKLLELYGGHPLISPTFVLCLEIGGIQNFMYTGSFGIQEDDLVYTFRVDYQVSLDFPVQVPQ